MSQAAAARGATAPEAGERTGDGGTSVLPVTGPADGPSASPAGTTGGSSSDDTAQIELSGTDPVGDGPRYTAAQAADPRTPLEDLAAIAAAAPELHPYLAGNPSTYPDLLAWLSAQGNPEVDAALAARGRR
ncbi:hypothetical protein GCM10025865_25190 [Paraoerskovia sediminicola]|uniref:Leucine rich repeat variant domain-containing protein n=1 Tax=Paraoerskovia sediminicola TaxID=1138587 RepID=A0ABM8G543_9CELL|nr:hypothetical protein [Paraoerskovia sediminicola]BDZ43220.1 hypothetical protein GCM10025865_25190 [Paraoerskovia sediminicola]